MKKRYQNAAKAGVLLFASTLGLEAEAASGTTYCDEYGGTAVDSVAGATQSLQQSFLSFQSSFPGSSFEDFLVSNHLFPCESANATQQASVRNFTTAVSQNIQFQILQSLFASGGGGSSGDASSNRAWNTWGTPTFTSIESNLGFGGRESTNSYQFTFGGDTKIDQFIFGASGSYTRIDAEIANGADDYRVAPYAAYSFNKNLYATAIMGYNRKRVDNSKLDGNGLFTDASLNYILPIDSVVLVGRAGHRFGYFAQEGRRSTGFNHDDDSWDNTYYISGEALYKWGDFLPFLNVTWEHFDPEDLQDDMDSAFLKLGVQYAVHSDITLGLNYQTELTGRAEDQDVYYNQAGMDLRLRF
ncbi:MAG TPA: autotransporter outer membrane beta-barrel domain-containing protein [Methylococcaceae bacterium]|nr:autotransporter outer membrane beta-barrel domain-containing protein [Methylococcaceae bacterium]